jgi:dTDP-4-dehydrorhamnose reductase
VRVLVTGAGGFVGSNVAAVAAERGHDVVCLVRSPPPWPDRRCTYVAVDLLDEPALRRAAGAARPDAIVHTAILNDFVLLYENRELAWRSYVDVTRTLADAANETNAVLVYVSTDWVFDGTQPNATEQTPPNPINLYGFLKAVGELVVQERPREAAVARIAGVMGTHRARPQPPRTQDAGFGYFVASAVDTLERGEPFTVWESDEINMYATPSLASHSAELMLILAERRLTGVFHCCGREPVTRMELARRAAEAFELDPGLLRSGAPDPAALTHAPIPYDTTLDARATEAALGVRLPDVAELLQRFRAERQTGP